MFEKSSQVKFQSKIDKTLQKSNGCVYTSLKMIKFEILKPVNDRVEYASQQLLSGQFKVSKTQGKWLLDRISVG